MLPARPTQAASAAERRRAGLGRDAAPSSGAPSARCDQRARCWPRPRRAAPVSTSTAWSRGDLVVGEVGRADPVEQRRRRRRRRPAAAAASEQRRRLALAQVVADRLAGDRCVAEHAEEVVAQLERLAERQADGGERVGSSSSGARRARRRGAAAARRCTCPTCTARSASACTGSRLAAGRADEVEVLADARARCAARRRRARHDRRAPTRAGCRRSTNAKSPTRIAAPSPNRRGSPRQPVRVVAVDEAAVHRRQPAARCRSRP